MAGFRGIMSETRYSPEELFWGRVRNVGAGPDDCWVWVGEKATHHSGDHYGRWRGRRVHRVAYEMEHGPIPKGLVIDHLCRNRLCCNPAHLEAVSPGTNTLRGTSFSAANAAKTCCPRGHEYTPDNTYIGPLTGYRYCRTCRENR